MKTNKQIENILLKLHDLGGCDATEGGYDDGWDSAITAAIEVVENETDIKLSSILERK